MYYNNHFQKLRLHRFMPIFWRHHRYNFMCTNESQVDYEKEIEIKRIKENVSKNISNYIMLQNFCVLEFNLPLATC